MLDLKALDKARPRSIDYASYGIGSMPQLNFEALNKYLGIQLQHVAFKGAAAAVTAVVSGEVGVTIASAPSLLGYVRDRRLRALAVGAERRLDLLPDVPTMAEAGGGGDTLLPTYFGLAAPAGTSPEILAKLNAELKHALATPDIRDRFAANGLIATGSPSEEMANIVKHDLARFRALINSIGLKPE